jgi:hypothetical protein
VVHARRTGAGRRICDSAAGPMRRRARRRPHAGLTTTTAAAARPLDLAATWVAQRRADAGMRVVVAAVGGGGAGQLRLLWVAVPAAPQIPACHGGLAAADPGILLDLGAGGRDEAYMAGIPFFFDNDTNLYSVRW